MTIELIGLEGIPIVDESSDISQIIKDAINKQGCEVVAPSKNSCDMEC